MAPNKVIGKIVECSQSGVFRKRDGKGGEGEERKAVGSGWHPRHGPVAKNSETPRLKLIVMERKTAPQYDRRLTSAYLLARED